MRRDSWWVPLRLGLATVILLLGLLIIGRSLWFVIGHGLDASTLVQPLVVGGLMITLGLSRWRAWWTIRHL